MTRYSIDIKQVDPGDEDLFKTIIICLCHAGIDISEEVFDKLPDKYKKYFKKETKK